MAFLTVYTQSEGREGWPQNQIGVRCPDCKEERWISAPGYRMGMADVDGRFLEYCSRNDCDRRCAARNTGTDFRHREDKT